MGFKCIYTCLQLEFIPRPIFVYTIIIYAIVPSTHIHICIYTRSLQSILQSLIYAYVHKVRVAQGPSRIIYYNRYLYNIFRFSFINLKAKYDLPIICRYTLCGCSFEIWIIYYICFFVHERFTKYNMWCVIFC